MHRHARRTFVEAGIAPHVSHRVRLHDMAALAADDHRQLALDIQLVGNLGLDDGFPIMHVIGIRQEIVKEHPWVPINLYHAFNESKAIAMKRMVNPRIVPLAWYRESWEEQEEILGPDPWEYGMTEDNENQLKILVGYSAEQGMIGREIPLDELFVDVSQGRKRGDEFRM